VVTLEVILGDGANAAATELTHLVVVSADNTQALAAHCALDRIARNRPVDDRVAAWTHVVVVSIIGICITNLLQHDERIIARHDLYATRTVHDAVNLTNKFPQRIAVLLVPAEARNVCEPPCDVHLPILDRQKCAVAIRVNAGDAELWGGRLEEFLQLHLHLHLYAVATVLRGHTPALPDGMLVWLRVKVFVTAATLTLLNHVEDSGCPVVLIRTVCHPCPIDKNIGPITQVSHHRSSLGKTPAQPRQVECENIRCGLHDLHVSPNIPTPVVRVVVTFQLAEELVPITRRPCTNEEDARNRSVCFGVTRHLRKGVLFCVHPGDGMKDALPILLCR